MVMLPRIAMKRLESTLERFPAVALLGPRQVGKTTLALAHAETRGEQVVYLDLERPSDLAKLADPEQYLALHRDRLVILDEIQRVPGLFQLLRSMIDEGRRRGRRAGQYLLLGSASIDLLKQSAESLAGRIAYLELTPLLANEVSADEVDVLWLRGGFPDSFRAPDDEASLEWRQAFIQTYLERDIPSLGPRIPAETLRRFWTMLAHEQGGLLNASRLAGGLGVSGQTVARYLDLLVDLLLVRRLQPWTTNEGKRLVRSPKVYVRDAGLVHALLGLGTLDDLLGHPVVGGSYEGFVIENLLANAPTGTRACFYRTAAGAEIDLILELGAKERWAVEVKRSLAPSPSPGFFNGCEVVGATRRLVIYPGTERFPIRGGAEALGLRDAIHELRKAPGRRPS